MEGNNTQNGDIPYVATNGANQASAQAPTPLFADVARPAPPAPTQSAPPVATTPAPAGLAAAPAGSTLAPLPPAPPPTPNPMPPAGVSNIPLPKKPRDWRKLLVRTGIITLVLLLIGAGVLLYNTFRRQAAQPQVNSAIANTTIPLSEFANSGSLSLLGAQSLTVNGQLRANESFVLTPNAQPTTSEKGELYYDKNTNALAYYNGNQFVQLTGNAGVQTLQGQNGNVTLVGGNGVTVNGTTITNSGVTSFDSQTGAITLGTGLAMNGAALQNTGITSAVSGSTNVTVATDTNGQLTISVAAGGTGTVQSPGGTSGTIALFTANQTIDNSIITQSGTTVTITGNLNVATGTVSLSNALAVASGGTGTNTLASNGVIVGNGTSPVTSVTAASAGLCLMSTAGAPAFGACPGGVGSGVDSLNGLTGILTLSNATGSGSTITINDASTTQKGIAQFNSTNFTASGGVVNTIQNIAVTATPTFGALTVTSSQATSPMLLVNNTNVGASGNLIDLQLNGSSKLALAPNGNMTLTGTINGQTISSSANFTGSVAIAGATNLNGGASVTGTLTANTITPSGAMTVGATGQSLTLQGNASSVFTATNGANTTTLAFQTPTANVTYRLLTATAGTYDICTTAGNCAGVGGGVTTPGGTTNHLAKFTGSQAIGDSIITDNGSTVTIGGVLAVNTVTPTGAMTVGATNQNLTIQGATTTISDTAAGITNSLVFATPSGSNKTITLPNATGTVAVSASGAISLDANGNITCPSCVTGSAVTSLNGLTGALSVANASGSGSTITINDASTTQKGIAQFNSTNFTAASGVVNTVQDIAVSATPTFGALTLSSSQLTNPMFLINNTNIGASGNLLDLQLNGSSKFSVAPSGNVTLTGTINGQTISSAANLTGSLAVAGAANLNGGASVTGTLTANTITPNASMTIGATNQSMLLQGNASTSITATSGASTTTISFQAPTANVTYRFLTATAGTYDVCTTAGNCSGVGGGVTTPGGTTNHLAKFTAGQTIGDSIITDNGSTVTIGGVLAVNTVTPSAAMTIGATSQSFTVQGSATSTITATNGASTTTLSFQSPTANVTYRLLTAAAGTYDICTTAGNCLGGGGGGANTSLSNLTGVAINTSLLPGSAGSIDLGSSSLPFRNLYVAGSSSTPGTNNFTITGTATAARTITLPDATGTVCIDANNCSYVSLQSSSPGSAQTGNINVSGTIIAGTNIQSTLLNTADSAAASSAITLRSGNTTGGTGLATGGVTIKSGNGSGTNTSSGNVSIDSGTATGTGTTGSITIGTTNASSLTVGRAGASLALQGNSATSLVATNGGSSTTVNFQAPTAAVTYRFATASAGSYDICTTAGNCASVGGGVTTVGGTTNTLAKFTGSQTIGNSGITDDGTTVGIGENLTIAANKNFTLSNGTGVVSQTYSNTTGTASTISATSTASSGTTTLQGLAINLGGTNNAGGATTINGINFGNVTAATNNTFNGLNFGTGFNSLLTLGGSQLISGAGFVQNAALDSTLTYSNLTKVGTLTAGSIASGFGTITTTNTITGTTLNGTTGVNTGAGAGTQRIDSSGNLVNIGTITSGTINGQTISSSASFTGSVAVTGAANLNGGASVTGTLTANTITPNAAMTIGATGQSFTLQGNASSSITATGGGFTTTVGFTGTPTASVTYNFDRAATTGIYTICTTAGNCNGLGAVSSLDGLTGALTIANTTGSGTTITINDASTTQKGIAQFNSTNFTASGGTINTVQNINTSAAPTFGQLTLSSSQATNTMLLVNNTNVSASGNLIDLQLNGSSKFSVTPAGNATIIGTLSSGTINGQTISSAASLTGSLAVAGAANLNGGASVTGTLTANTITPNAAMTVGATGQSLTLQGNASSVFAVTGGGFTTTIGFTGTPTGAVTYNFDRSVTPGTYTVCTTANNCTGLGAFIQNGTGVQANANFNIRSVATGSVVGVLQGASGQTADLLQLQTWNGTSNTTVFSVNNVGALTLAGTGTTNFTTPQGSTVVTKINIPVYDPGAFGQIIAMGLPSSANSTARAISIMDARTSAHQPTLAVLSPNEGSIAGIDWNGSNSLASFQTMDLTSGSNSSDVSFRSGNVAGGSGSSGSVYLETGNISGGSNNVTGDVNLQSGTAGGTNGTSGNISMDVGTATGTLGQIYMGYSNASTIHIGHTLGTGNSTNIIKGLTTFQPNSDSSSAFQIQDSNSDMLFNADTTTMNINTAVGNLNVGGVANPGTPTLTSSATGGSLAAATYMYKLAAQGALGVYSTAIASSPTSVTTTGSVSKNTLSWTAVTNATGYIIYRSTDSGATWKSNTVAAGVTSLIDNGTNFTWTTSGTPQSYNATGAVNIQRDSAIIFDAGGGNSLANIRYQSQFNNLSIGNFNSGGSVVIQGDSFSVLDTTGFNSNLNITNTGATTFKNRTNSSTAFQIQDSSSSVLFNADTTNRILTSADLNTGTIGNNLFSDSFEENSFARWDVGSTISGTSTATIDSTIKRNGNRSAKFAIGSGNDYYLAHINSTSGNIYARAYVYIPSYTGTSDMNLFGLVTSGASYQTLEANVNASTHALELWDGSFGVGSGSIRATTATVSAAAWHKIEIVGNTSAGGTLQMYLDGVAAPFSSGAQTIGHALPNFTQVRIGDDNAGGPSGNTFYIDDLSVDTVPTSSTNNGSAFVEDTLNVNGATTLSQTTVRANSDTSAAFQIQNSSGGNLFNVDSYNSNITLLGSNPGALGSWTTSGNTLGISTYRATAATYNGYIYYLGGWDNTSANTGVYYSKANADGSTGTWSSTTALPAGRSSSATVIANGYIYEIGGYDGANATAVVYYAKLNADGTIPAAGTPGTWTTTTSLPAATYRGGVSYANGYIYVVGGQNTSFVSQRTVYYGKVNSDGTVSSWTTSANSLPTSNQRSLGVSFTANGYLYYMGGTDDSNVRTTVYYASLNPSTGANSTFTSSTAMTGVRDATATVVNGYVYVTGGNTVTTDPGSPTRTVQYAKLNPTAGTVGTWTSLTNSTPTALYGASSVVVNGYIYYMGGTSNSTVTGSYTNAVSYVSTPRVQVGGSLDLVGIQNGTLTDGGDGSSGSVGGSLTAGNGTFVGALQVQGQASFHNGANVDGMFNVTANTSGYAATIRNISTTTSAGAPASSSDGLLIDIGTAAASRTTGNYFVAFGAAGTVNGKIQGGGASNGVQYTGSGADYAEYFNADPSNLPQAGEIVALDTNADQGVTRANHGGVLVGVVSNNSSFLGNGPSCAETDTNCDGNYQKNHVIVGMHGQVPSKVSVANGAIHIGDPITASDTAGVGQKATTAGLIVGYAEQNTTTDGTIQVLIAPTYYDPNGGVQGGSFSDVNVSGTATTNNLNVTGTATIASLTVTGNADFKGSVVVRGLATVADIAVNGHIITGGSTPNATVLTAAGTGATVNVTGDDTAGTITITVGNGVTADDLAKITFGKAYTGKPNVTLTPVGKASASAQAYIDQPTTTDFQVGINGTPHAGETYTFTYHTIQ